MKKVEKTSKHKIIPIDRQIDEGFFDLFRGGSMTPEQKREYQLFVEKFVGQVTGQIERAVQSGLVSTDKANHKDAVLTMPTTTEAKTKFAKLNAIFESILSEVAPGAASGTPPTTVSSVATYLWTKFFPYYLQRYWKSMDSTERQQLLTLTNQISKDWNNRKKPLEQMAALVFNMIKTNATAPAEKPAEMPPAGTPSSEPAAPRRERSTPVQQAFDKINAIYTGLSGSQKKALRDRLKRLS